jgi:hypothetical protein
MNPRQIQHRKKFQPERFNNIKFDGKKGVLYDSKGNMQNGHWCASVALKTRDRHKQRSSETAIVERAVATAVAACPA